MAKLVTVVAQNGGVGKTTEACHLAFAAQESGKFGSLVVSDTQGNVSQFLSQNLQITQRAGGAEQSVDDKIEIRYSSMPNKGISLLHGHEWLEMLDHDDGILEAQSALRSKIRSLPFDYGNFDMPPQLGPRVVAPLAWSDLAVAKIRPCLSALEALHATFDTSKKQQRANPGLQARLMTNSFNKASSTETEMRESLKQKFGGIIIAEFSSRTPVADALDNFKPVRKVAQGSRLKQEWKSCANRVLSLHA